MVVDRSFDRDLIANIFGSPGVLETLSTDEPFSMENFVMDPYSAYLVARDDDKIYGLFTIRHWSTYTAEVHLVVLRQYWGTGISDEMTVELIKNLRITSPYKTLITHCPENCVQVIETAKRKGAKTIGVIENGTRFKGKPSNLHILSFTI